MNSTVHAIDNDTKMLLLLTQAAGGHKAEVLARVTRTMVQALVMSYMSYMWCS